MSKVTTSRKRLLLLGTAGAAVLLAVGCALVVAQYRQTASAPDNVMAVTKSVARHMILPADEEPALATVTDASKLSSPFLKHTHNGDKVLIYQKNRLAIIYRPSIDRIVSVGPVSIDAPPARSAGDQ